MPRAADGSVRQYVFSCRALLSPSSGAVRLSLSGGVVSTAPLLGCRCDAVLWLALRCGAEPSHARLSSATSSYTLPRVSWEGLYVFDLETSELSRLLRPPVPHPEAASPDVQPGQ